MQTISVGDVYFLKSPFKSTVSKDHAKRISYLLGTVCARPAVVIRPPVHWDTYMEVVVIPAIHNIAEPGIEVKAVDRYGRPSDSSYNFVPQTPYTLPVNRLGRYIGRLSDDELAKVREIINWIYVKGMDPCDIPEEYKVILTIPNTPFEGADNRDITLNIDNNMRLSYSRNTRDPNSTQTPICDLDIDFKSAISEPIAKIVEVDNDFKPAIPRNANSEKVFPPSMFDRDTLMKYAGGFQFNTAVINRKVIPLALFSDSELKDIREDVTLPWSVVTKFGMESVYDVFQKMTPMDVFYIGTRVPTYNLAEMTGLPINLAGALKRLCNAANNMPSDEVLARIKSAQLSDDNIDVCDDADDADLAEIDIEQAINTLRPWLTEKSLTSIPTMYQEMFMKIPKHVLRASYKGRKFESVYKQAEQKYRTA